jgi:hypothetical protein
MGKSLKTFDILGKIDAEEGAEPPAAKGPGAGRGLSGEAKKQQRKRDAEIAAAGKPSAYQSELRQKLRDKVQLNFAAVPRFVRNEYERLAAEGGMNMREYLYHLLREKGADIPPYQEMDGRKL